MTAVDSLPTAQGPRQAGWRRALQHLGVDVRPGEGAVAWLLFSCFFLLVTFQYATKSVRQSTFLEGLGSERLPLAYLAVALSALPVLWVYGRFADRVARHRLIAGTCVVIAASLVGCWWLFGYPWPWLPFVFYVWISIVYVLTVSQFWSFSNHLLDPRQAKRLFAFIGAGGLLGGIAGGQVARLVSTLVDTRSTFLVAAGILLATAALTRGAMVLAPGTGDLAAARSAGDRFEQARGGLRLLRGSRHLQSIAVVMALGVMVAQLVDLQFNWAAEEWTRAVGLDKRTAFFGNFFSIMGFSALAFQIVFTARIHRHLGVGFAMRLLPLTLAAGTGALFLTGWLLPGGLIYAAYMLKVGENGLRYSLDQVTRELLFFPVPSAVRVKVKAYIDVFVQRGAKGLAGLILLLVTFGVVSELGSGWISLGIIVLWLMAVAWAFREYVGAFRGRLRQRAPDAGVAIDLSDATTLEILVQSLGSSDPRQVLYGLDVLEANGRGNLVPPLLLHHADAAVRGRTLQILAAAGRRDALPLIESKLGDDDPDVRAEVVRTLAELYRRDASALMLPRLRDPDPGVRAAAIACLADHGDADGREQAAAALLDMLGDADCRLRVEAVKAIGAIREPAFDGRLVQLLYDGESRVAQEAIVAVRRRAARDGFNPVYVPTLIARLQDRRLKHEAREALVALGPAVIPMLAHFLVDPQESAWVRRAIPKTLARFRDPAATAALLGALDVADDAFLRRKAIEALATVERTTVTAAVQGHVRAAVREEARRWLEAVAHLAGLGLDGVLRVDGPRLEWDEERRVPDLLYQLLVEDAETHMANLFALLALLHPASDIRAAHRGLVSGSATLHTHALEYLDNTLSGEPRRAVFAVIGDDPLPRKLRVAGRMFGIVVRPRLETLAALLDEGRAASRDGRTRAVAALHSVYLGRTAQLFPRVEALAVDGADELVRDTAAWIVRRLGLAAAG